MNTSGFISPDICRSFCTPFLAPFFLLVTRFRFFYTAMSGAWYMDEDYETDQREAHRSPNEPADVDMSLLADIGVLHWKVRYTH